jgi:hypothetical protein
MKYYYPPGIGKRGRSKALKYVPKGAKSFQDAKYYLPPKDNPQVYLIIRYLCSLDGYLLDVGTFAESQVKKCRPETADKFNEIVSRRLKQTNEKWQDVCYGRHLNE